MKFLLYKQSMLNMVSILACVFILCSCSISQTLNENARGSPLLNSRQIVVVVTNSWHDVSGELYYFERPLLGDDWETVTSRTAISLGRAGLAWGNGLQGNDLGNGPIKHEGDGKSPAGVFKISAVFGYAPKDSAPAFRMPYIHLNPSMQCIDDINSIYYNLVIDSSQVKRADWTSYEQMRRNDVLYKWGALIDHNVMPRKTGDGSCIFLHIWNGPTSTTSGCTALDEIHLLALLQWLDISKNPVLIQLPKKEYDKLKVQWHLPLL